jgi:hypothetical protein
MWKMLLLERGIEISHDTVRFWRSRFGPKFAAGIRKKCVNRMRAYSIWQWHLDDVFVKINGGTHYLWRAAALAERHGLSAVKVTASLSLTKLVRICLTAPSGQICLALRQNSLIIRDIVSSNGDYPLTCIWNA